MWWGGVCCSMGPTIYLEDQEGARLDPVDLTRSGLYIGGKGY